MDFIDLDLDYADESTLINVINNNIKVHSYYDKKISELKNYNNIVPESIDCIHISNNPIEQEKKEIIDWNFEDEIEYYLSQLRKLNLLNIENDFFDVIPSQNNYQYERILRRLELESYRSIKEIKEMLKSEGISGEEINVFSEDIELELKKISMIKEALIPKKDQHQQTEIKNKLIFVPTPNGNIRVLEEIDSIHHSYYERFEKLFNSIKDGTFKNVKRFCGNSVLDGLCEVKGDQVRVVFMRLSKDAYAVISAFIKKTDLDLAYRTAITKKYNDYLEIQNVLKEKINNEEFIKLNKEYEEELFKKLVPIKEYEPQKKKGIKI